jgi:hypothetical protein
MMLAETGPNARAGRIHGLFLGVCAAGLAACGGSKDSNSKGSVQAAETKSPAASRSLVASEPAPAAPPAKTPSSPRSRAPSGSPSLAPASQSKPAAEPPKPSKPASITLAELSNRRDLWPSKVKLTKKLALSPSEVYPVGKELDLVEIAGTNLHLDTGNGLVEVPAANTDVLERASEFMASLTPDQLALTAKILPTRPELWPTELTITSPLGFSNGMKVPAGRKVVLRAIGGDQVSVYDREFKNYYPAAINETDVMARARERLKLPEAERQPFFGRSIAAALDSGSSSTTGALPKSDYFIVYQARLGCERCAAFLPTLEKFYDRVKATHPEFEAVFVSADFNADDMKKLQAREKLPGCAVAYDRRLEAAELGTLTQNGELLPLVYVFDKNGKMVTRNAGAGGKPSAEDVLATLEKKLGEKH